MPINNPEKYVNSIWNWDCLWGCFGQTKIRVTDLDGMVERHGYFFVIETKGDGVNIPDGQEILFNSMVNTGHFTVAIIWGKPQEPHKIELRTRQTTITFENTSMDKLRKITSKWYEWAENQTAAPKFSE